jgi:hypothetical protein
LNPDTAKPLTMFVERRTVSRKTPKDGKLEITKPAAEKLSVLTGAFDVDLSGSRSPASLGTMECTCRGADTPHVHYFIQSSVLQRLSEGEEVEIDLDASSRVIRIAPTG